MAGRKSKVVKLLPCPFCGGKGDIIKSGTARSVSVAEAEELAAKMAAFKDVQKDMGFSPVGEFREGVAR